MSVRLPIRRLGGWAAGAVLAWFLGGWWSLGTLGVAGLLSGSGRVPPRALLGAAVGVLALAPLAWLANNADRIGRPTFDLVLKAPWPGRLALMALTLLSVGVALDVLASGRPTAPTSGEQE